MTRPHGPRLYVVARPVFDEQAVAAFLTDEDLVWRRTDGATAPEEIVELAGRVCYLSFGDRQSPRTNSAYVTRLVEAGHHSVLEHATWSFVLTRVTRAFTHQFVRHRIGFSYSQLSQQYHDERDAEPLIPDVIAADPRLAAIWRDGVDAARGAYRSLIDALEDEDLGLSGLERIRLMRSAARTVLPAATETKIAFTANARALRHFLAERGRLPGDDEMRDVSVLLLETMRREAPSLFADFHVRPGQRGEEVVASDR